MISANDRELCPTHRRKKKSDRLALLFFRASALSGVLRAPVAPLLRTVERNEVFFSMASERRAFACKRQPRAATRKRFALRRRSRRRSAFNSPLFVLPRAFFPDHRLESLTRFRAVYVPRCDFTVGPRISPTNPDPRQASRNAGKNETFHFRVLSG